MIVSQVQFRLFLSDLFCNPNHTPGFLYISMEGYSSQALYFPDIKQINLQNKVLHEHGQEILSGGGPTNDVRVR